MIKRPLILLVSFCLFTAGTASAETPKPTLHQDVGSRVFLSQGAALDTLLPSTVITLHSKRTVTIATLQAEHIARMQRLGNGRSYALEVISNNSFLSHATLRATLSQSAKTLANSIFASDYVNFCAEAKAPVCLYLPGSFSYEFDSTKETLTDTDPYMTQDQCTAYNGIWSLNPFVYVAGFTLPPGTPAGWCGLVYPAFADVHFNSLPPNHQQIKSTCMKKFGAFAGGFTGTYDPHGYFNASIPVSGTTIAPTTTMSCLATITS